MTPTTSQSLVGQSSTKPTRNVRGATAPLALIFALGALLCALMASPAAASSPLTKTEVLRTVVLQAPALAHMPDAFQIQYWPIRLHGNHARLSIAVVSETCAVAAVALVAKDDRGVIRVHLRQVDQLRCPDPAP